MYLPQFAMRRQDDDISHLLNHVHCCDAMALLRRLPDASVDMVLCDLPYGVLESEWDELIPMEPLWLELKRVINQCGIIVLTATEPFATDLRNAGRDIYKYDWIWINKQRPTGHVHAKNMPLRVYEKILIFSKGVINHANLTDKRMNYYPQMREGKAYKHYGSHNAFYEGGQIKPRPSHDERHKVINSGYRYPLNVIEIGHNNHNSLHPTQKPVALFEYLIRTYTQEGEIVLDMTCGSGTTGLAARKTGRQFICGDNHLPYVELARKRLQDTDPYVATELPDGSKQLSLFEGKGA